jgi:5'-deoxynucleotidase
MYHDTSEIITGDMPTPIKYYNEEIKGAYKQIEAAAEIQLKNMLPEDFREEFGKIYNPDNDTERLVKAADKISAYIKCVEEMRSGNREFAKAETTLREAVEKYFEYEEIKYFCETFLDSFKLTLDELD